MGKGYEGWVYGAILNSVLVENSKELGSYFWSVLLGFNYFKWIGVLKFNSWGQRY